jgi:hypothetical protein
MTASPELTQNATKQDEQKELEAKFQDEVLALEKKYAALYDPLYEKVIIICRIT